MISITESASGAAQKSNFDLVMYTHNNRQPSALHLMALPLKHTRFGSSRPSDSSQVGVASTDPEGFMVYRVPFEDKTLVRHEMLVLAAIKSKCGKYFTIEAEDLGMSLSEPSLHELKEAFDSVLRIVWRKYALGDPQNMTQNAAAFRDRLISTYRLI